MTENGKDDTRSPSVDHSAGDQESGDIAEQNGSTESKTNSNNGENGTTQDAQKPASNNPKDPSRPRRKKARRACFACQRAHLTCGDERPCQRCIKRGLQDACHDGVRKKAKYLHDAPDGALMPGVGANFYNQANAMRNNKNPPFPQNGTNATKAESNPGNNFYASSQPSSFAFDQNKTSNQILSENTISQSAFNTQSPVSPTFSMTTTSAMPSTMTQQTSVTDPSIGTAPSQSPFGGAFFDPSDPALFNFDLASMNFGNRYGALEFGMLGHMATGAGDTPPSDTATQRGSVGRSGSQQFSTPAPGSGFGESPSNQQSFMFGDTMLNDWSNGQIGNLYGTSGQGNLVSGQLLKQDAPHAFAIGSGSGSLTSPPSTTSPQMTTTTTTTTTNYDDSANKSKPVISTPHLRHQSLYSAVKRRDRDPSSIYESVKEPYSYTNGFHKLIAFIQRRFCPRRRCGLPRRWPRFRTLWEYEDFINACGTPTIVCRRTGEVAAVGKEFSILTGWKKEVLLGKAPNLNVNTGGDSSGTSSRGSFTPRDNAPSGTTQPVFLAELLDDDSVIEFYEDFARLAFGDSRGSVMNTCKLLKYKTKEDMELVKSDDGRWNTHVGKGGIAGEAGMNRLGFKDGKVECSYCWTVKRDVFDIPMLIVMNFLPHI
ncbi:Transcription activator of gluconeogenesis acuK [Rasamsonia emersonii CBS 393.64]|uniref:Transcription activator of gluconeogenesis acuK n=1 Tax=Rasamsonia emersonii (strain ATCC 16479 / CBS 393.64 / IMI 116815) TaxID=1408163 RepID=A0A0F4YXN1_RASE3|nr:Transcription activator of gluconeogenesis acuK [Rasamsonia emersonii CBS 393.64]KKA22373.1 Transcription activator of gluconeogenesis acuK [Rasamsonia emersonii CBS 393.64]